MKDRIKTGVIGIIAIGCIIWLGEYAVLAALTAIGAVATYEYATVVYTKEKKAQCLLLALMNTFIILSGYFYPSYTTAILISSTVLLFIVDIITANYEADYTVYGIWGLVYVGFFLSLATKMLAWENGLFIVVMTVMLCMASDIGAYFAGMYFGKHKLCPAISPKKTVEGSIGGVLLASVVAVVFAYLAKNIGYNKYWFVFIIIGAATAVLSQFGDLAASMVKRKFGAKDYGNILPGHGGFMDRLDSILFGIAAVFCTFIVFGVV